MKPLKLNAIRIAGFTMVAAAFDTVAEKVLPWWEVDAFLFLLLIGLALALGTLQDAK